ncbi:MAG TPA: hypothetical protein VE954_02710 [Oligoflexus sp.]|uniref:hypothetical protein n=1 Tax=Oligoflexus sp. TaxID=1971216 RepID=UPI002D56738B|nr:hypothetical protein [Oligoflexus sp.]HYX31998.1 hypothetical protein [Oligoflexus sp.]
MKNIIKDSQLIENYKQTLGGVFSFSELATLFADPHKTSLYRRISELEDEGVLQRFIKGFYVAPNFDIEILNQKICPQSYISFTTVLSENSIIGMKPGNQIDAVKLGKTRIHKSSQWTLRQFGVAEHLIFGFESLNGVNKAAPEKALLDTFYFHQHGVAFPFDVNSEINWKRIDAEIVQIYLQEYKNPKFVAFMNRLMSVNL